MPKIPVPLAHGHADAVLDLQAAFSTVYDRSDYDYSIDHDRPLKPPVSAADAAGLKAAPAAS